MQNDQTHVSVEETEAEKDLGVFLDNALNFRTHTSEAIKNANTKLGMIRRKFVCLNEAMLTQIYIAIVHPHLEYANVI